MFSNEILESADTLNHILKAMIAVDERCEEVLLFPSLDQCLE